MSRITLSGNASGTGNFTLASPNSNTDRTLTLPDATGTVNVSGLANEVPAGSAGAPAIYPTGDSNTGIFFPAADTIAFAEGGAESMRIDASGNVGIGTSSPTAGFRLHAVSSGGSNVIASASSDASGVTTYMQANGSTSGIFGTLTNHPQVFVTNNTERARIDSNGNLLVGKTASGVTVSTGLEINTNGTTMTSTANAAGAANFYHVYNLNATNNGYRFYVQVNGGIANFSANNVNLSDERAKTDIAPLGSYWDKIKALEVVTYKYRDQSHEDDNIGVIAQQVESVAPEFVSNDGFGETPADGVPLKSIYEADLHYAALKALQEAMTRIEALEARITALEAN
jgi:hypothetical protein